MKSLQDKVSNLSGIGPKKELALKALGIETIEDLLCYYPFRYEDMATKEVSELADGQKAVIQGVVATAPVVVRFGRAKNRLNFKLLSRLWKMHVMNHFFPIEQSKFASR